MIKYQQLKLDESTARWHLKSPQSLSSRSLVTKWSRSHLTFSWQSNHFWQRYSKFHIWPWKFKVKVMPKVKPNGHIWGLENNRYVCFLFRAKCTIFGWDIANSIFDLENSRSRSWPSQTQWSHMRSRVQSMCLLYVSWQSDQFWSRYSKFHIWPWKFKVKVTTKIDQNLIR